MKKFQLLSELMFFILYPGMELSTIRYVQLFVHISTYRVRDLSGLSPNSRFHLGWKNPRLKHRNVIHYVKKSILPVVGSQ